MKANDFTGVDLCVEEYPGASFQSGCLMTSTANSPAAGPVNHGDVVIVGPESIGSLSCLSLESGLKSMTGAMPTTAENSDEVDVTGKWCIFLGGMDRSILSHLTQEKFQALQRLLSRARGLLWVVSSQQARSGVPWCEHGHWSCPHGPIRDWSPVCHSGSRRTGEYARCEAVSHMLNVFKSVFCQRSQLMHGDWEFVVRNGNVCVPRLVDNHALNLSVQQETPTAPPQLQPFKQSRALKLAAGDGRGLDELYFTDDVSCNAALPDDHIEIQVCSTGLNFRDVLMAMGQLKGDRLGQECSGVVTKVGSAVSDFKTGDRVSRCRLDPCPLSPGAHHPVPGSFQMICL